MATNFGLLVGRFSSATPVLATDNELRELRLDAGGRLHVKLTDGNDKVISYFTDGAATGTGTPDDRGLVIMGKNDTDNNYQMLRVNSDGSLVVSFQAGSDISAAADDTGGVYAVGDVEGEVALTVANWVLIQTEPVISGQVHVAGWSFCSDKNTVFQLCLVDDVGAGGVTRADVTKILDTQMSTSARPSDHVGYNRAITNAGGANISVAVFAKQLQVGTAGVAWSAINAATTT